MHYLERFHNDEFSFRIVETGRPLPETDFPAGIRSQRATLRDKQTGAIVALVHWFRLPTGELGGGGNPDPIRIYLDSVIYYYVVDGEED